MWFELWRERTTDRNIPDGVAWNAIQSHVFCKLGAAALLRAPRDGFAEVA